MTTPTNWDGCPRCATRIHRDEVAKNLRHVAEELLRRAAAHDASKLVAPEVEAFDAATERLRGLEYGSDAYRQALADMKPALDHHYATNAHHPEHWPNGWRDMSLLDLLEMLCDWAAAGKRHATGSMEQSLIVNRARFGLTEEAAGILRATAIDLGFISQRCGDCANLNWPDKNGGGQCRVYSCSVEADDAGPLCAPSCPSWCRIVRARCTPSPEEVAP